MAKQLSRAGYRVYRGGGWYHYARYCRSAYRYYDEPSFRLYHLGVRLAIPLKDVKHNG